ncbi:Uncharacterised protein [Vibrio cholerae]|nr:Uncharacterised protein [Vibrio cholerae]
MSEFIVIRDFAQTFTHQHFSICRYFYACHFSDSSSRLTYDLRVQSAINQQHFTHFVCIRFAQDVRFVRCETLFHFVVNFAHYDSRLLRSTHYTVVERFRHQDRSNRTFDICSFIDNNWNVTCTYTDGWFTRRVSRFHHPRTTRRKDQCDTIVFHQSI